jgi:hypothetical protein
MLLCSSGHADPNVQANASATLAEASNWERRGVIERVGRRGTLHIHWSKTLPTRRREILLPADLSRQHRRPIRSDTKGTLIVAIAHGRLKLQPATRTAQLPDQGELLRGGNSTGVTNLGFELGPKRLEMLREIVHGGWFIVAKVVAEKPPVEPKLMDGRENKYRFVRYQDAHLRHRLGHAARARRGHRGHD